jgi:(p)ppGpp synthase/HD superfamily hydrolase
VFAGLQIFRLEGEYGMALSARFEEALVYAARLHAGQTRKGTDIPYIGHLLGVTSIVLQNGGDEDQAIAALLHDAVEDAGGVETLEQIRSRFGEAVAGIVAGCTDSWTTPKPEWRPRKEAYIAHLAHASQDELLVAAADKLHNAQTILNDYRVMGEAVWDRFTGRKEGTLWYYHTLVDTLRARYPSPVVEELARVVSELEALVAPATETAEDDDDDA